MQQQVHAASSSHATQAQQLTELETKAKEFQTTVQEPADELASWNAHWEWQQEQEKKAKKKKRKWGNHWLSAKQHSGSQLSYTWW